jgi:predicted Fe-S protein YdhL (DUF1289 family)
MRKGPSTSGGKEMMKAPPEDDEEVKSPCRKKCSLDRNRICPSCFRSMEEIASWRDADTATKRKILEAVAQRRRRA